MAKRSPKYHHIYSKPVVGLIFFVGLSMFVFISILVTQLHQTQIPTTNAAEFSH